MAQELNKRLMIYSEIRHKIIGCQGLFRHSFETEVLIEKKNLPVKIGLSYDAETMSQPWILIIEYDFKGSHGSDENYCFKISPNGNIGACYRNTDFIEPSEAEILLSKFENGVISAQN